MALAPITAVIPIWVDADGVMRVSETRVTLDTIVATFKDGATAEEIAQQYPVVPLADVYSIIGFYLRTREEIEAYLTKRQVLAGQMREVNENRYDPQGIRERLMARQSQT